MRSIYRDGFLCTAYEESTFYDGSEGELYDLHNDPQQFENLWDDASRRGLRNDLVADLYDSLPEMPGDRRACRAPV